MILVTGAESAIGVSLARELASAGVPFRAVTADPELLRDLFPHVSIVTWPQDPTQLDALCRGVTSIVHLAMGSELESPTDPLRAAEKNTLPTLRLLHAAEQARVERFLLVSFAEVYGTPLRGRLSETSVPRPSSHWAASLLAAEHHLLASHDRWSIGGIVLRVPSVVGASPLLAAPRWTHFARELCRHAVSLKTISVKAGGEQPFDFVPMSDVIHAIWHLLDLPFEQLGDGLFNLGSGRTRTALELAELIASRCEALFGFRPMIVQSSAAASVAPLDIRTDKLLGTGFELWGSLEREIDETLLSLREELQR